MLITNFQVIFVDIVETDQLLNLTLVTTRLIHGGQSLYPPSDTILTLV